MEVGGAVSGLEYSGADGLRIAAALSRGPNERPGSRVN